MRWFITFHVVCLAWVFFRAESFDQGLVRCSRGLLTQWGVGTLVTPMLVFVVVAMVAAQFVPNGVPERVSSAVLEGSTGPPGHGPRLRVSRHRCPWSRRAWPLSSTFSSDDDGTDTSQATRAARERAADAALSLVGDLAKLAAGQIVIVGLVAFGLAGLFNAESLYATARRQPYGVKRTVALDIVGPVRAFSRFTKSERAASEDRNGHRPRSRGRDPQRVASVVHGHDPATRCAAAGDEPDQTHAEPSAADPPWVGGDSMAQEFGTR